jgi:hypothetical protein
MALKASGAYRHCKPCAGSSAAASRRHHPYHHRGGSGVFGGSDAGSASDRFHYAYRRAGSSAASTPRLRSGGAALSSGDATPSMSVRTDFPAGDDEEDDEMASEAAGGCGGGGKDDDAREWVAQVEPGVLITFVSLAQGGNDLKRIRFRCVPLATWGEFSVRGSQVHYLITNDFVCFLLLSKLLIEIFVSHCEYNSAWW